MTLSTFNHIAQVSQAMKKQLKRDKSKKHPEWFRELQKDLSTCYDTKSTEKVMQGFIKRYE